MLLKWTIRFLGILLVAGLGVFVFVFWDALYHRFVTFPNTAAYWASIRENRMENVLDDGWKEYRGVCHSHSEISHDSEVPFDEILAASKEAGLDFICMTDHCVDGKADYSLQWRGMKDGVLFVPGYELSRGHGFMIWGLPEDTIIDCDAEGPAIAEKVESMDGALFISHSEEERQWELPQIDGMEIYNIHTDMKDEDMQALLPDIILNRSAYPYQTLRLLFDRQTEILEHWDELNKDRDITGIAASDAHQNVGFRLYYSEDRTLLLKSTGPDTIGEYELNPLTRFLLWIFFLGLEPGELLYRVDADPYENSLKYVNTHVLANELTEDAVLGALKDGRAFIAFDMIVDASGFVYFAEYNGEKKVMGQEMPYREGITLRADAPVPCMFTVIHNGRRVFSRAGRELKYTPEAPGKYRVEADLDIGGDVVPWIYTNPITLL